MKATGLCIASLVATIALSALPVLAVKKYRHWTQTKSETIWVERYSNCDYGYFVRLPKGVVAHDTLPPSPNHGFGVNVAAPFSRAQFDPSASIRVLWVDATYDVGDDDKGEKFSGSDDRTVQRRKVKLEGVPATRVKVENSSPKGKLITENITAIRGGIVYQVELQTTPQAYVSDLLMFDAIVKNWHFLPLPKGECHNE